MSTKSLADRIDTKAGRKVSHRDNTTWCRVADLYIVRDRNDPKYGVDSKWPLYDERVERPLDQSRVDNLRQNGQINAVKVWVNGDDIVVIAGKRRCLHIEEQNRQDGLLGTADEVLVRVESVPKGSTLGDLQRLMLAENHGGEPETPTELAAKLGRFLKHSSPDQLRIAVKKSKPTFDNLMAFIDLDPEAKLYFDPGVNGKMLPLAVVQDVAGIDRDKQVAYIQTLLANNATLVHELRAGIEDLKQGRAPRPPREAKKVWSRAKMERYLATLVEQCPTEDPEVQIAAGMAALFLGDTAMFKKLAGPHMKRIFQIVDKDGEKRREAARKRQEKRAGQSSGAANGTVAAEKKAKKPRTNKRNGKAAEA